MMFSESFFVLFLISVVNGVDIFLDSHKTVFSGNKHASLFGYSVILHGCDDPKDNCMLRVGAPKTISTGGIQTGAVFQCSTSQLLLNGRVSCTEDSFNSNVYRRIGRSVFSKDDIWYGATIAAMTKDSYIACAPRLSELYGSSSRNSYMLMFGGCLVKKASGVTSNLIPFSDKHSLAFTVDDSRKEYPANSTIFYYAFAQAGMSLKIADNTVIIGAPGVLHWTGGVAEYSATCDSFGCSYFDKKPFTNPFYINEVKQDDYLGYSVESGVFDNTGITLHLAGAPRSGGGFGQVLIFESSGKKVIKTLTGPHLGSYFGATILCADVNGDNLVDILVGAPNYVATGERLAFDQGAVVVYVNIVLSQGDFYLDQRSIITGSGTSGARFGSAIANVGDIDGDGFNDIAIGAPWADNGESGVVFIYKGGKYGLESNYLQKITAEGSKAFGFSISNSYDVDANNCNDFAIGAPNSNQVFVYKCIPSIEVIARIEIDNVLNLPQNATNFTTKFHVSSYPYRNNTRIKIHLKAKVTVTSSNNDANLFSDSEYPVVLTAGDYITDEKLILVKHNANLSRPITIEFKIEEDPEFASKDPLQYGRVSEYSELYAKNDIKLMRDCGTDLICIPSLTVNMTPSVSEYIPCSGQKLGVNITIFNSEEPAYDAKVYIFLPLLPKRVPSGCSLKNSLMICNALSPLNRYKSDSWELEFEYENVPNNYPRNLNISALVKQINSHTNLSAECIIQVTPKSEVTVKGKTFPNETILITRDDFKRNANITFSHVFEIKNAGPSHHYDLHGVMTHPEMVDVYLMFTDDFSYDLENTVENGSSFRTLDLAANATVVLTTKLTFNLEKYGSFLDVHSNWTFTSILELPEVNMNATVSTLLILEPNSPLWPIIVGVLGGVLVLAIIVFAFNKCGFFSRPNRENLKKLQLEETIPDEAEASCSNSLALNEYESSQLLLLRDNEEDKDNANI